MRSMRIFLIGILWIIVLTGGGAGAQGEPDSGAYDLCYTAQGNGSAQIEKADGYFLLRITHTKDGVTYAAADGVHTHPSGCGQYTVRVTSGFAQVYYNGQYSFSYYMPRTKEKQEEPFTVQNGIIISGITLSQAKGREMIYQKEWSGEENLSVNINSSCHYDAEFHLKEASGQKINLCDGGYRLELLMGNQIQAAVSEDGQKVQTHNIARVPAGDVYYRVSVHEGIAQIFGNNRFLASFRLPKSANSPRIEITVPKPDSLTRFLIRNNRDRFTFYDSFDCRGEADSKAYWSVEETEVNTRVLLSTAGKSPRLLAKVIPRQKNGAFFMTLCYQNESTNIKAGYNFDRNAWELYTTYVNETLQASFPAELSCVELELEMTVSEGRIQFFCNGEQIFDQPAPYNGGRVGFLTQNCPLQITEAYYEGESPVTAGITEQNFYDLHTVELVQTEPDNLFMIGSGNLMYQSRDHGVSWQKYGSSRYFSANTLFLKSGKLLSVQRVAGEDADTYWDEAWISDDRGDNFTGPYRIETRVSNRITMNNKLTQLESGRIIFCAGESGHGKETQGAIGIYYSDDDGVSWQESDHPLTIFNTGVNVQEGKVIELPGGTLRCYMRTDLGFLYYSESTDQGKSWNTDLKASEFISALCAMNIERDPYENSTYYMVWEHNNTNGHRQIQYPRNRVSLAVSYDGCKTWEYVTDLMEFTGVGNTNLHANQGIRITRDAVYANVLNITNHEEESGIFTERLWRIDKKQIRSIKRFPGVHSK